jgi:hypothetical protein
MNKGYYINKHLNVVDIFSHQTTITREIKKIKVNLPNA